MTRDVDIAVDVRDDADAEQLTRVLLQQGYAVHAAIEHLETGRLATMRLLPPLDSAAIAGATSSRRWKIGW